VLVEVYACCPEAAIHGYGSSLGLGMVPPGRHTPDQNLLKKIVLL
jgi:hypothetical protein